MASVGFGLIPGISGYKQIYGLGRQLWRFSTGWKIFRGYYFRLDSLKFTGIFRFWVIPTFNSLNSLSISKGPKIFHQDSYSKRSGISVSGEIRLQKGQGVCFARWFPSGRSRKQRAITYVVVKLQHRTFLNRNLFNDGPSALLRVWSASGSMKWWSSPAREQCICDSWSSVFWRNSEL